MSTESLIGIGVSVGLFIIGLFVVTNRKKVSVKQENRNGTQNMNNNNIGNEININKKDDSKK